MYIIETHQYLSSTVKQFMSASSLMAFIPWFYPLIQCKFPYLDLCD